MMGIAVLTLNFSFATTPSNSTNSANPTTFISQFDDNELKEKWDKALGSFQFELLSRRNSRKLLTINLEVIYEIEANRHETDVTYISYNEFTRIKILPKNQISGAFQKLDLMTEVDSFE